MGILVRLRERKKEREGKALLVACHGCEQWFRVLGENREGDTRGGKGGDFFSSGELDFNNCRGGRTMCESLSIVINL